MGDNDSDPLVGAEITDAPDSLGVLGFGLFKLAVTDVEVVGFERAEKVVELEVWEAGCTDRGELLDLVVSVVVNRFCAEGIEAAGDADDGLTVEFDDLILVLSGGTDSVPVTG